MTATYHVRANSQRRLSTLARLSLTSAATLCGAAPTEYDISHADARRVRSNPAGWAAHDTQWNRQLCPTCLGGVR